MVIKHSLSPAKQLGMLLHEFPSSDGYTCRGTLVWKGEFSPTALSGTYKLKITFTPGNYPQAFIISPKPLPLAEGAEKLPHTYKYSNGKQELCLFLPSAGEWNSSMHIAHTIVHWAVQWMYYYEIWMTTGKWMGGGHGNWDSNK